MEKKLKTKQEILNWFGDKHVNVTEVLQRTDNRVMYSMYRNGQLGFDFSKREYYVNKALDN